MFHFIVYSFIKVAYRKVRNGNICVTMMIMFIKDCFTEKLAMQETIIVMFMMHPRFTIAKHPRNMFNIFYLKKQCFEPAVRAVKQQQPAAAGSRQQAAAARSQQPAVSSRQQQPAAISKL